MWLKCEKKLILFLKKCNTISNKIADIKCDIPKKSNKNKIYPKKAIP